MTGAPVVWARDERVLWRTVVEGVLVLPHGRDDLVVLGGSGAVLWEALGVPCDMRALTERVAREYGVEADVVEGDVVDALRHLADLGAVREMNP